MITLLAQVFGLISLALVTVSIVLYLRAQSHHHLERAFQARMDALRSAAELRELAAHTSRQLRDAALEEAARRRHSP